MRPPAQLRGARAAFTFLTRIPVGGFPYSSDDWRWSTAYFPLVGAAVGGIMAAVWTAAAPLGSIAAAILAVAAGLLVTGGFHEDGLADTADALGGAYDRERVHEILKDSRVGTFGALALAVSLALRVALIVELGAAAAVALVFVQSASRLPPIWLMVALPYATPASTAKSRPVTRAGIAQALLATVWPVLLAEILLAPGQLLALAAIAALATALLGWRFAARVGGITGDFLGATQQVVECALLAALVWLG
jgi:adenosylcobinamide-GDP ribazoletransferase